MNNRIIVCGADERFYYLCRFLVDSGYSVRWIYAENYPADDGFIEREAHNIDNAYAIILPLPLSADGKNLNTPFCEKKIPLSEIDLSEKYSVIFTSDDRISGINYFSDEGVKLKNARLTAIGFLGELLRYETEDIKGKKALVTGYGRVSQAVSDLLLKNGVGVTVAARSEAQRILAETRGCEVCDIFDAAKKLGAYDYIINTVPKTVFRDTDIEKVTEKTAFFELAAGLLDKSMQKEKTYIECRGLPGKCVPESAGRVIAQFILGKLKER